MKPVLRPAERVSLCPVDQQVAAAHTEIHVGAVDEGAQDKTDNDSSDGEDVLLMRNVWVDWEWLVKIKGLCLLKLLLQGTVAVVDTLDWVDWQL